MSKLTGSSMNGLKILVLLAAVGGVPACAFAQARPMPDDAPPPAERGPEVERVRLRETLERRRDAVEQSRMRIEEALRRLENGEPMEAIRRDIPSIDWGMGGPDRARGEGRPAPNEGAARRPRDRAFEEHAPPTSSSLSPAVEDPAAMRRFVDEHLPRLAERLREMEAHDPEAGGRMLRRLGPRLRETMGMRGRSPETFSARVEELRLSLDMVEEARRVRRAIETEGPQSERAIEARRSLRTLAEQHFDAQARVQQIEVRELEAHVAELRAEIERKAQERDAAIDRRVEDLVRDLPPGPEATGRRERRDGADRETPRERRRRPE